MSLVEFEQKTLEFERAKTVHALYRAVTVISAAFLQGFKVQN
jgi:hypothetical protein